MLAQRPPYLAQMEAPEAEPGPDATLGPSVTKTTKAPHDAIFKSVFQEPKHAAAELRHILPGELASAIQWSSLKLEPGSFVDPKLADQHSDLLFSADALGSRERVLVYLLFEHQSTNDPMMALRMLSYMVRIWTRYAKQNSNSPLPLVIPALLAQVQGGWSAPSRFSELFATEARQLGRAVLPDFTFAVDDLHLATDEDLRQRALPDPATVTLWLMRDVRDRAALFAHLVDWADALERIARSPGGDDVLALLLRYIAVASGDLQLSEFRDILKGRAPAVENLAMTIAELLEAKVLAQGIAQGEAKGRAEGRAEGIEEGRAKGIANSILMVLAARKLHVNDDVRRRIEDCTNAETLDHWLVRAATAASADDIFGG